MPLKTNVGVNRKIADNNFGSRAPASTWKSSWTPR